MKIGLINPNKDLKHPAIHLGLGYLVSYTKQFHIDLQFELLDTRVAKEKECNDFLESKFDGIGLTASSQVFEEAVDIAKQYKNKFPDVPVFLGGSHVSTVGKEAIKGFPFDFAVYGEGEITFNEIILYLKGKKLLKDIDGLIYKNEKGEIIKNPPRQIIKDINEIPFPDFSVFPNERYPQHRLTTSRGCPYQCVFCNSHSIWTNRWRKRSAKNIFDEINQILDNYGRKTINFNDDSFNIDLNRINEFCNYLIENQTGILWSTAVRADRITPEVAAKMKQAGCYAVSVGIESANNEMLKRMKKHTTKEKIYNGIQVFRNAGIDVTGQFMIGNPGDTLETVKESIEFAKISNLTNVDFYTALPYQDTLLWEYVKSHGTLLTDEPVYRYHAITPRIIFETPEFSYQDRLKAIQLAIDNNFYDALTHDSKSWLLDTGKNAAKLLQKLLGKKTGNKMYLFLRKIYRKFR